jgi:hypothetical protein
MGYALQGAHRSPMLDSIGITAAIVLALILWCAA